MNIAVLLLGGSSVRFNSETPKQFLLIEDTPLFCLPLTMLEQSEDIDEIIVVTNAKYFDLTEKYIKDFSFKKVKHLIIGGASRRESVFNALTYIKEHYSNNDIVLIHDAARPYLEEDIIKNNIETAKQFGAAVTAIKCSDSVLLGKDGNVDNYLNREFVYLVQTPQTFRFSLIYEAHTKIKDIVTDDASLVKALGYDVKIVEGKDSLFKVTHQSDLIRVKEFKYGKL